MKNITMHIYCAIVVIDEIRMKIEDVHCYFEFMNERLLQNIAIIYLKGNRK